MELKPARLRDVAWQGDLTALEPAVVRLVTIVATVAAMVLAVIFLVTGETGYAREMLAATIAATTGMVMTATGRTSAIAIFMTSAALTVSATRFADIQHTETSSGVVLVMIGIMTSVFVQTRRSEFIAAFSVVIVAANILWTGDVWVGIGTGMVTAVTFVLGSITLSWVRTQVGVDADRYQNLFARAPVSIWEEDFTDVARFIEQLRDQGVVDLESFLASNPSAVRVAAGKIHVKAVNKAAVELTEAASPSQLLGRISPATLTGEALKSIIPQLVAVWNREEHIVIEVSGGRTHAGNPLDAILSWTVPRIGDEPDLSHVIVCIVDVTAIRTAQAQLEALLRSKDEFVASVSHELRTPLTAVVGLASELRDSFPHFSRTEVRELVDLIAGQSEEVSTIVEDLLAVAKADAGTLDVSVAPIDAVKELWEVLRGMSLSGRVQLDATGDVPAALADAARVRQIVRNLLVNAQRYGGKETRIVARGGKSVAIEVRDTGNPLAPDERDAIFERYYRARQVPGLTASVGLGLTVSRDLARRMGGDLVYDHDGTETIFRLSLPLAAPIPV